MEVPLVLNCSKLKTSFQQQPPRLVRWGFHPSPSLPLMIGATEDNVICRIEFMRGKKPAVVLKAWKKNWPETEFVADPAFIKALAARISGKAYQPALHLTGTNFQLSVWRELQKIPAGKVVSYAEVARRIKNPKAIRAVGTACGANPIPLLVPCHRVVGSNGGLGGFGGGLPLKKVLLRREGVNGFGQ